VLVCFTSDLHGDPVLYEQLEELLRAETPDLLILGGDLLSDGDPLDPLGTQVVDLERVFLPRLAAWQAAAPTLTIACITGNHEWTCTRDALREHSDAGGVVLLEEQRPWELDGVTFVGYSTTPPTPHWVKDFERLDAARDPVPDFPGRVWDAARRAVRAVGAIEHFRGCPTISDELADIIVPHGPWILVAHAPPFDSKLDQLYKVPFPVGSLALRRFIEQHRPICSLHGHVHESPALTGQYKTWLGETLSINPGQGTDRLQAVLFEAHRPAETLRHTVFS
jgi:uncharacterized protein